MTHTIEAAISEARWKARHRHQEQFIVRYRQADKGRYDTNRARYTSSHTLAGAFQKTRVGESPLCILSVTPDGYVRSRAKEFDTSELCGMPRQAQHHETPCPFCGGDQPLHLPTCKLLPQVKVTA